MTHPGSSSLEDASPGLRRFVTLLFSDLSDSTKLSSVMEAEDYAELLTKWRVLCKEIVPQHGGSVVRMQGDGMLALFGHPVAAEDDGRRATEAALQLHAGMKALVLNRRGHAVSVHSGVHAGLVLVSEGDIERGRFELAGETPNIASRLASHALADQILVSEESLGPLKHFFLTSDALSLPIRGRARSLKAYDVRGVASIRNRFEARALRGLCPLIGRNGALRSLAGSLDRARSGEAQRVVLVGAAGVGKSRLLDELLRSEKASFFDVHKGYCESYLQAEPLQPFAQIARALAADGIVGSALIAKCDAVSRGVVAAARELFAALASAQPQLLVIDDWQWADEASQQMLDAVASLDGPVCVVVASRVQPDWSTPGWSDIVVLEPLEHAEAVALVRHLRPDVDPFVVAEIHRYAGGNPLFLEELCHVTDAHDLRVAGRSAPGGAAWLHGLIESRVQRLPAVVADLVRVASVIGNVVPQWLMTTLTGHASSSESLQRLAAEDLLYGDSHQRLRFKHGITRDVVYESVGLYERRALHRRIAQALESHSETDPDDSLLESLAYHHAGGASWQQAAVFAERAGDKAMDVCSLDRARTQYSAALHALDSSSALDRERQVRWSAIAQKLGSACVFDPLALTDGVRVFERAVELAAASSDLHAQARAEYWLGYVCYAKGSSRSAIAHGEAALALATTTDDAKLVIQVRATLGQALLSACRYDEALVLLDEALDGKRRGARPGSGVAVGSAYALACKGYLLGDRGRFDSADSCFAEALQLLGDVRHQVTASVHHWLSVVLLWRGEWDEAMRSAERAIDIADHVKSRQQLAMGKALAARARSMLAPNGSALAEIRESTAWIEARRGGLALSLNHAWLVEGFLDRDDVVSVRHHAAKLFARARADDRIGEALGCRALALAAAAAGDFARAERYLRQAGANAERRGSLHERASNALCAARVKLQRGQRGEAARLIEEARDGFEAMKMGWHLGQVAGMERSL